MRPHSFQGPLLVIHDLIALYLIIGLVHKVRLGFWVRDLDFSLLAVVLVTIGIMYVLNVYHFARQGSATDLALRTFSAVAISGALVAAFIYVTKSTTATTVLWRGNLPLSLFCFALWATVVRYAGSIVQARIGKHQTWVILGDRDRIETLRQDSSRSVVPARLAVVETENVPMDQMHIRYGTRRIDVGLPADSLYAGEVDGIVLATDRIPDELTTQLMHIRLQGVPVMQLSEFYEQNLLRVPVLYLKDQWFAFSQGFTLLQRDVELKIKRLLDVLLAAAGLLLSSPLMLVLFVLVRATSDGPAIYSQLRCGLGGRQFMLHKFRTMVDEAESQGPQWSQPDDPRITWIGGILRKNRLDELPQLWNVLMGDMSFIGPRPERPDFIQELEKQIPYYELRHLVKPGITGWAQVMYPYGSSVDDARNKLEFDLYYIKNYSLALDAYIFLRTIRVVLARVGR